MWESSQHVPQFRVRTREGIEDPAAARGQWLLLVHCNKTSGLGFGANLACFDSMAERLPAHDCRLLVALDLADEDAHAEVLRRAALPGLHWKLGVWDGPRLQSAREVTQAVVVDPHGTVRASLEIPSEATLDPALLIDLVRRAQTHALHDSGHQHPIARESECLGCVDWFDFKDR